jgi:hypothetical protein
MMLCQVAVHGVRAPLAGARIEHYPVMRENGHE